MTSVRLYPNIFLDYMWKISQILRQYISSIRLRFEVKHLPNTNSEGSPLLCDPLYCPLSKKEALEPLGQVLEVSVTLERGF